ncbi:PREDICTED: probable serine/threonine-protein kinase DDB_G0276461 [Ceratosolen solmsi marchali]|uniref:Probable serine/threonine-protein kinase DDB_G0276461 n=1 Tax=Ceratosolen solmsi marchali TaxID=326594 RepID=A0AAJ6YFM5_9HYME|nr:PREDICTED: probable serine/threonine-protein kinase DDB_G0276461 [Ceratosolen solmsi marchali]
MSKFKDLYKKNGLTASRRAEQRIDILNCQRKNQRFHTLDSRREKVTLDLQDSKRNNKTKNTLNNNSKKKWRPIKEQSTMNAHLPPFIVGVVRHKIHSPPFLHESINVTEKKKNCQTTQQSFAPKNYKFKPPKELKTNICTPLKSTHELPSFTFGTLLSKPIKKNANKKDINFSNINIRPRNRKLSYDLSFGSDTVEVREDNNEKNYEKVEKQLSPKASEVPIFGRSNVLKALQKSANDLSEDLKDQSETNSFCNLEKSIITSPKLNVSKIELGQRKTYQELNTVVNDTTQISQTLAINVPNYKIKNTTPLGINKNVSAQESPKDEKRTIDSNFLHRRITTESLDQNQIENSINSIEKDNKQIHTDIDQRNLSYQQDVSPKIKINTITLQLEDGQNNPKVLNDKEVTAEINNSSIPVSLRYSNNRCDMITNNSFDHNVNSRNVQKGILSSSLPNSSIENLNNSSKFNNMEMEEESMAQ